MASNDDTMINDGDVSEMDGMVALLEPDPVPETPAVHTAKKARQRSSEVASLSAEGYMSKFETRRLLHPVGAAVIRAPKPPQPQAAPVVLEPRPRPAPGAMAVVGEVAAHERPGSQGIHHWKKYGMLPPA